MTAIIVGARRRDATAFVNVEPRLRRRAARRALRRRACSRRSPASRSRRASASGSSTAPAQKIALQAALDARAREPPLDAADARARRRARPRRSTIAASACAAAGSAERTVYLDNRQMDGKVGFFVVTPLRARRRGAAVLVQRGWVPRNFDDRTALPAVADARRRRSRSTAASPRRRRGCSSSPAPRAGRSGKISTSRRSRARPGSTCCRCRCCSTTRRGTPADGLLRHWPPPAADVQKHYGYAFQWFAIARRRSPSSMSGSNSSAPAAAAAPDARAAELHACTRCRRRRRRRATRAHRARPLADDRACCWSAPRR